MYININKYAPLQGISHVKLSEELLSSIKLLDEFFKTCKE